MKTIIEPFRIKSVEPIYFTSKEERQDILEKAFYNPFLIHSGTDHPTRARRTPARMRRTSRRAWKRRRT